MAPGTLFEDFPEGFEYRRDVISAADEQRLADEIGRVEFATFEMRGVAARRRVAFFGKSYDVGGAAPPIPGFLQPLREELARWAGVDPAAFAMALINEYRPGAPIGWHRDAPQYDIVAGVSLLTPCRMKFRPYVAPRALASQQDRRRTATHEVVLDPRSGYLMRGKSRTSYEHHIPAVRDLRYSITFRTLR